MQADLLPADGATWSSITIGESGATVLHDRESARYAKLVPAEQAAELAGERDRIRWLEQTGIPGPSVLEWRRTDDGACLVTRAVPGVPAAQLDASALRQAWPTITALVRELHNIPPATCPFDRGLATMMPLARTTVAANRVQRDFLPEDVQHVPPRAILGQLEDELARNLRRESNERVVCHGDLCLPNILVDPDTLRASGLVDLGRLGRADPYADIALLLTNARESWPDELTAREADHGFAEGYGIDLDADRLGFYQLLDPLTWPR
ncbi:MULTISPECIES: APH(3'') family aminoglycoside O-phosphotransferase [Mumia]|nr:MULTISPECIES: APH(3'') family aminoglycoside O-phosphotransferase [Mumia]